MRRMIPVVALAVVVASAVITPVDSDRQRAAAAPPPQSASNTPDDFMLLHEGDYVRVLFREEAGPGSIRFLSLSDTSRLDILHPVAGAGKYYFRGAQGWQTYPHGVGGQVVTIILRETGDNVPAGGLPGCSDVALRIEGAAILSPHHTDGSDQGRRCEVCGALLDW